MSEEIDYRKLKKIAIIGCGLIGGSIGMALKKKNFSGKIIGVDQEKIIEKAIQKGAIDWGTYQIEKGVVNAEVVFLATPVLEIIKLIPRIKPFLSKNCLITDTGSTKKEILDKAEKIFSNKHDYIGSHPMAGLEKGGIEYASSDLFVDKPFITIPKKMNSNFAEPKMSSFIHGIGAVEIKMDINEHDRIIAMISHLPQLIAVLMTNMMGSVADEGNNEKYFSIGGKVFNEMTRIASSPFPIWKDIFQTNKFWTIKAIEELVNLLESVKGKIANNTIELLEDDFRKANYLKERILKNKYLKVKKGVRIDE